MRQPNLTRARDLLMEAQSAVQRGKYDKVQGFIRDADELLAVLDKRRLEVIYSLNYGEDRPTERNYQ